MSRSGEEKLEGEGEGRAGRGGGSSELRDLALAAR